jgi:hypothetical protein
MVAYTMVWQCGAQRNGGGIGGGGGGGVCGVDAGLAPVAALVVVVVKSLCAMQVSTGVHLAIQMHSSRSVQAPLLRLGLEETLS